MAQSTHLGKSGLGTPFLGEAQVKVRKRRTQAIVKEAQAYLEAAAEAVRQEDKRALLGVETGPQVEYPVEPPLLRWLDRIEQWGLPLPGTFLQQPAEFLEDVEAARLGRELYRTQPQPEDKQVDFDRVFRGSPASRRVM